MDIVAIWPGEVAVDTRFPLAEWPVTQAVMTGRAPGARNADDPRFAPDERRSLIASEVGSLLAFPLRMGEIPLGMLTLYAMRRDAFNERSEWVEAELATQAALAIQNARLTDALRQQAETDGLTGLLNHRAVQEGLDRALAGIADTTPAAGLAVLLVDFDDFKRCNDTHGHLIGDRALRDTAAVLRASIREGDLVGRYGGDVFLLVQRAIDAAGAARAAARVLTLATVTTVTSDGQALPLCLSIGLAMAPRDGAMRADLVAVADAAMYAAKRDGGGHVAAPSARSASGPSSGIGGGLVLGGAPDAAAVEG